MSGRRQWRLWLGVGLGLLLLAFPLAWLLYSLLRETALVPIAAIVWWIGQDISAVSQHLLWGFVVLLALCLLLLRLIKSWNVPPAVEISLPMPGPVASWRERLRLAQEGSFFQRVLAHEIGNMLVNVLAHRRQRPPREVRAQLRRAEIDLPPDVPAHVLAGLPEAPAPSRSLPWASRQPAEHLTIQQLEAIVRFLEEQMEV